MTTLTTALLPLALLAAMAFLLARARRAAPGADRDFTVRRRTFLTPREYDAFRLISPIAEEAGLHVCPQASMDAFLKFEGKGGFRERGRYKARRSDFALMDRSGNVVAVVEIDDASHQGREDADAARDRVVSMAGIPTARIPAGRLPDAAGMRRVLASGIPRLRQARQ